MFPSFYIYNETNFQTILDITDMSVAELSKYDTEENTEDDSSINSDFVTEDDSIEQDLESIYSESLSDSDFDSSVDDNESIATDYESIVSNPIYVSSGISITLLDEELFEDENDERELAIIIEVQKCSTNYTDIFTRKIYKKKTNNYEKVTNLSIAIFTIAVILNWFS